MLQDAMTMEIVFAGLLVKLEFVFAKGTLIVRGMDTPVESAVVFRLKFPCATRRLTAMVTVLHFHLQLHANTE